MNVVFFGFKRYGLAHIDERQAAALKNVMPGAKTKKGQDLAAALLKK